MILVGGGLIAVHHVGVNSGKKAPMLTNIIVSVSMAMFKQDNVTLDLNYSQESNVGSLRTISNSI